MSNLIATVEQATCVGCGLCADTCPEVFVMNDDNLAEVIVARVPDEAIDSCHDAADSCPVSVISLADA